MLVTLKALKKDRSITYLHNMNLRSDYTFIYYVLLSLSADLFAGKRVLGFIADFSGHP